MQRQEKSVLRYVAVLEMLLPFPYPLRSKRYNPVSVPTIRLTPIYREEDKTKVSVTETTTKKGLVTNALLKTKKSINGRIEGAL